MSDVPTADQVIGQRLFDDAKRLDYSPTIEVERALARELVETVTMLRGDIRAKEQEIEQLRSLLASDAAWRRRADDEPLRSMVSALLGAVGRQELHSTETPYDLAKRVADQHISAMLELKRESEREFKVVAVDGFPGVALARRVDGDSP